MQILLGTFQTALHALGRNVVRSILTCLGIIIGVAAVITMMEIGRGSSSSIRNTIALMGADNIIVWPGTAQTGGVSQGLGSVVTLHPQDCEAIRRECTAVRSAAPLVKTRVQVIYGNRNWSPGNFNGTTPDYIDIHSWPIGQGHMFTEGDVRGSSRVCVIGTTISRELFQGDNPIGKSLRLNNVSFRVVGVLVTKGASMTGADQDDVLLCPWTSIKHRVSAQSAQNTAANGAVSTSSASASTLGQVNSISGFYPSEPVQLYPEESTAQVVDTPLPVRFTNIDMILLASRGANRVPLAMHQVRELLRERHRLSTGQPDDFNVRNLTEFAQQLGTVTKTMTRLLVYVAIISLIVGGVGIMNIMLVSVTERTREIGLRMAVGARARDILAQFLIEAIILSLIGGAVGIVLGRLASLIVRYFGYATEISVPAIILSVLVSGVVGVVFGFYPAWKASGLDPIEALRYE
ncbi:MAG TPA: ABC transporter permease [Tepidisphaeraceae bacterium]|jgi:ABC-type antimicrobial peptide transport system permease subunit|nr:ABC transporter permease [Tepidisphaeraceae bacterium]